MSELLDEFKQLQTDEEKWRWVIAHQSDDIVVYCDNDATWIIDTDFEDYADFDNCIGWQDGVFKLLDIVGIKAEAV